jgi:hypothetical protein
VTDSLTHLQGVLAETLSIPHMPHILGLIHFTGHVYVSKQRYGNLRSTSLTSRLYVMVHVPYIHVCTHHWYSNWVCGILVPGPFHPSYNHDNLLLAYQINSALGLVPCPNSSINCSSVHHQSGPHFVHPSFLRSEVTYGG